MTHITLPRAAVEQALEALKRDEEFIDRHSESWYLRGQADLKFVRETLEELEK